MLNLEPTLKSCLLDITPINATSIKAIIDDDWDNTVVELTLKPDICFRCNGTGKTLYGSLEGMAFTQSDFEEDPDFREQLHRGTYDVPCPNCLSTGVMLTLDKELNSKEIINRLSEFISLKREIAAEDAHNQRMGY